jgi:hypothetical protein
MIQRIQSIYLSLTIILSLFLFKGANLNFIDNSGSVIKVTFTGIFRTSAGQSLELVEKLLPFSLLIILIPAFSLITVFLFKNRNIQLWLALSVIILIFGLISILIFYSWNVISEYKVTIVPGFKMVIPILMLVFSVLAYRGIKKDDRLIKSYDRLR